MTALRSVGDRLAAEDGYTLTELLTVLAILGTVLGALTALFVSATRAEVDMNERFRAQQNARLGLNRMRRDIHCSRTATGTAVRVTLTRPAPAAGDYCASGDVSWCTVALAAGRWGLFRKDGATCDASGVRVADYLVDPNAFGYPPQASGSLATLSVTLRVDIKDDGRAAYRLEDTITLRRSARAA